MRPLVRLGELDAVPGTDAVAVIAVNEGGSGERIALAIVGVRDGRAVSVATAVVGDRTRVRDVRVSGRDVVLDVVEIGPGEAACCGTQLATRTYRLEGSTLQEQAARVTGKVSLAATVAGYTWTAVALDGVPMAAGVTAPTLTYAEGRISGTSACNQYTGPIAEPAPGTLEIGPTVVTRRACDGAAGDIERQFLKILAVSTRYTFQAGRLVFSGLDGDQMRSITFSR
jgi:heat shock protein HslJ